MTARLVGYATINGCTFAVDLLIVSTARGVWGWPVPAAFTVGYAVALGLGFWLNRWLNFRSRAPVGPALARYVLVLVVNFAAIVLGVGAGLAAVGVPFPVARAVAAGAESLFLFAALRWFVFPDAASGSH